jgi:hypothetical protein
MKLAIRLLLALLARCVDIASERDRRMPVKMDKLPTVLQPDLREDGDSECANWKTEGALCQAQLWKC